MIAILLLLLIATKRTRFYNHIMTGKPSSPLRRGWTTGACATAATRAAYSALLTGMFPDPVRITLPRGQCPEFTLAREKLGADFAMAGIIKDAGDDPDVTHKALILATVRHAAKGSGIRFRAGAGVGTVTRPGLPIPPGEPAINPVPRELMRATIMELATRHGASGDVEIEISIPGGEALARHTLNGRLGIVGGLSILGTTGVVIPFSCAAWIASIHRGVDVCRAAELRHIAAATGSTSEAAVRALYQLSDTAIVDMGDFAGGLLKYLRRHPVPRLTIAGGFAKLAKLAQGSLDLHSGRSQLDQQWLADAVTSLGGDKDLAARCAAANSGMQILQMAEAAKLPLADFVARRAADQARQVAGPDIAIEVLIFDRQGRLAGRSDG